MIHFKSFAPKVPVVLGFLAIAIAMPFLRPASAQNLTARITNAQQKSLLVLSQIKDEGSFQLQRTDGFLNWIAITNFNAFPGTTNTTPDSYGDARRFYRLIRFTLPPVITLQPQGFTNYSGMSVRLEGAATGSWPLRYQWYKDAQPVTGATSNVFVFAGTTGSSGAYTLIVSSPWGTATSQPVAVLFTSLVATNISGKKIHFEIQNAQGDYFPSGTFDTAFDLNGFPGFYSTTSTAAALNDSGGWQYGVLNETTGLAILVSSFSGDEAHFTLVFQTVTTGTYGLRSSLRSGFQTGKFTIQ